MKVHNKLNLLIGIFLFSGICGSLGVIEMNKNSKLHQFNFYILKQNYELYDLISRFNHGEDVIHTLKNHTQKMLYYPYICMQLFGNIEKYLMFQFGAKNSVDICQDDMKQMKQMLTTLSKYESGLTSRQELISSLVLTRLKVNENIAKLEPLIEQASKHLSIFLILSSILKTFLGLGFCIALARGIRKTYDELSATKLNLLSNTIELEAILNNVREGIIVTDMNYKVKILNFKAKYFFGELDKFEPQKISHLHFKNEDGTKLNFCDFPIYQAIKSKKRVDNLLLRFSSKEHESFLSVSAEPLILKGSQCGAILSFRDLTKETLQKLEIERSNRSLDEFIYIASHDLKSPLRAIKNLSIWIQEDSDLSQISIIHIKKIQNRVNRMQLLLDDLLKYSRIGRSYVTSEWVNLEKLVCEIYESLDRPSEFNFETRISLLQIYSPKAPLDMVLRNLIGNAIKHRKNDDGCVQVKNYPGEDMVIFTISDNGPKIPIKHHKTIFKMFQTLSTQDQSESTGMGLALVKKTVELHGGTIRVGCENQQGNRFIFSWPIRYRPFGSQKHSKTC